MILGHQEVLDNKDSRDCLEVKVAVDCRDQLDKMASQVDRRHRIYQLILASSPWAVKLSWLEHECIFTLVHSFTVKTHHKRV